MEKENNTHEEKSVSFEEMLLKVSPYIKLIYANRKKLFLEK